MELKTELEVQGIGYEVPQNPLQHDNAKTTEYYYALKDSANKEKAKARIAAREN